jgi:hypothetical protein
VALQQLGGVKPQGKDCKDAKKERRVERQDKHCKSPATTGVKTEFENLARAKILLQIGGSGARVHEDESIGE